MGERVRHNRHSIRLPGYDYATPGDYFITLVASQREELFGEVRGEKMCLNELGRIVQEEWERTAVLRENVELGVYVVMPDHFHAIVRIIDWDGTENQRGTEKIEGGTEKIEGGTARRAPTRENFEQFGKPVSGSIPTIVRSFKAAVTKRVHEVWNQGNAPVWQRNYYEHIIRSEREYAVIEAYIENNPAKWGEDGMKVGAIRELPRQVD